MILTVRKDDIFKDGKTEKLTICKIIKPNGAKFSDIRSPQSCIGSKGKKVIKMTPKWGQWWSQLEWRVVVNETGVV